MLFTRQYLFQRLRKEKSMTGWILWNVSQHRQEVGSLFPSKADAESAVERLKLSSRAEGPDELVAVQVEE